MSEEPKPIVANLNASNAPAVSTSVVALQERRRKKKAPTQTTTEEDRSCIMARPWLSIPSNVQADQAGSSTYRLKVMTWNVLAQSLVRRELFPTSDCLKAHQREHMLYREMTQYDADIMCFQEVDRLEKIIPVLENKGYLHSYACGPNKKHGCLIAYRASKFERVGSRVVHFDSEFARSTPQGADPQDENALRAASFRTKNIGSIVALRDRWRNQRVVVATTHLFWHPRYHYERARQATILFREVARFHREITETSDVLWRCLVCGDFNFTPADPAYSLIRKDPLLPNQLAAFAESRVVHHSIDPSVPLVKYELNEAGGPSDNASGLKQEAADNLANHPDRIITNARRAVHTDGLLDDHEFQKQFATLGTVYSAYDEGQSALAKAGIDVVTCGARYNISPSRKGLHEPMWTSYTHYWKTVLDYIFVVDNPNRHLETPTVAVTGLLLPPRTDVLHPGLPRKGVSGSDHVSLVAELEWSTA